MYFNAPRQCLWIDPAQDPAVHGGYVPSLVIEGEPGHSPLAGRSESSDAPAGRPWVWGPSLEQAEYTAAELNATTYGLSREDSTQIVLSSIRASF